MDRGSMWGGACKFLQVNKEDSRESRCQKLKYEPDSMLRKHRWWQNSLRKMGTKHLQTSAHDIHPGALLPRPIHCCAAVGW